jgi:hypothetical protein
MPQVVSELLQNSLDAGARQIDIGIDCEEWSCWVRDDGVGIGKDGLSILGKGSDQGRYGEMPFESFGDMAACSNFGRELKSIRPSFLEHCLDFWISGRRWALLVVTPFIPITTNQL